MKLLKTITTEMFADQGSGHAPEDSKSRDGKRKFVVTVKRGDGTEVEKNVKAFSIGDIKHHFGKDFVDAELHQDEMQDSDDEESDDRTADEQDEDELTEGFNLFIANAYGAGYDSNKVHKGEMLPLEDGDVVEFVQVTDDGKQVTVKKDGKQAFMSAKELGGKILPKGQRMKQGTALDETMFKSIVKETKLGSRVSFDSYEEWMLSLPSKHTMHKDGKLERAQATGKDFEGVAGTWDEDKMEGWIYSYYLDKKNLIEDEMKYPAGLTAEEKYSYRKGWQNPGDTPEDWEFKSRSIQGNAFRRGQKDRAETLEEQTEGLSRLQEMAKRSKPDDFYAMAKKKYGAEKVKSLKWPEIVAVAKENDVLIPPYLRSQKVGRGMFNLVPPEHADSKPDIKAKDAAKEEPKKEAPKAESKAEEKYEMPQLENVSYSDWSEFYGKMKQRFGTFELKRVEHGRQTRDRFGTMIGPKLMVDSKTGKVMGMWEVTGSDKVPGRGFVAYGNGYLAKEKQEPKKEAPKQAEKRKGGQASADEMKAALLDATAEMRHHKDGKGADWRFPTQEKGSAEAEVRYWGHWEGDDGSGDYDFQELSERSSKEVDRILQQAEKRHPTVKLSFSTSEKNWLYIKAE